MKVFFRSKTGQLGVVFRQFFINGFNDILSSQNTQQSVFIINNRNGLFSIFFQICQNVSYFLVVVNYRIFGNNEIFQYGIGSGFDQFLQIYFTVEPAVIINNIQRIDVIVILRLPYQFLHGFLDGQAAVNDNVVGCHSAADFVIVIGTDHADIAAGLLVQQ